MTTPVVPSERIHALDILRGFALLGMILVHFHRSANDLHDLAGHARTGIEEVISWAIWLFVETKSHGTFAFLFGAGFAILLRRAEARGAPFLSLYLRRLLVLAFFGFAAHALFGFNVLLSYAYGGLWLLVVRRWSVRTLLVAAMVCAMVPSLFEMGRGGLEWARFGQEGAIAASELRAESSSSTWQALARAESQPSYAVTVRGRLRHMAWFHRQPFFFLPGPTLCLFLLGMLAVRCGILEDPRRRSRWIAAFMVYGVAAWAAGRFMLPRGHLDLVVPGVSGPIGRGLGLFEDQWLAFTYIGGLLLLLSYREEWVRRLAPLAWAGRMALTNYLLQIAFLDFLFAGYGLGLGIRESVVLPATLSLFGIEVALSRLWLQRY
ncbi:MAG TPA: DUF418 domain-containing protein, partial [Gemmatimonadota bacterium]|nr:DUF418 domain-containing protein [Gemmatimonadota bacterium]